MWNSVIFYSSESSFSVTENWSIHAAQRLGSVGGYAGLCGLFTTSNIADGGDSKALLLYHSTKLNSSTNAQLWHVCPIFGNILLAAVNFSNNGN